MLAAGRDELESSMRVAMLAVRDRELRFFITNCNQLATLSALLAGFGQSALLFTKYVSRSRAQDVCDPSEFICADTTYPFCVLCATGFSLFALWGCMLITFLAPVLALKGPEGSMHRAVEMVVQEYQYVLFLFSCSLLAFFLAAVMWSLTRESPYDRWFVSLICFGSVVAFYYSTLRSLVRFEVSPHQLVTGRFRLSDDERHLRRQSWHHPTHRPAPLTTTASSWAPAKASGASADALPLPDAHRQRPSLQMTGEWTSFMRWPSVMSERGTAATGEGGGGRRRSSLFGFRRSSLNAGLAAAAAAGGPGGQQQPSQPPAEGTPPAVSAPNTTRVEALRRAERALDPDYHGPRSSHVHAEAAPTPTPPIGTDHASAMAAAAESFRLEHGRDATEAPARASRAGSTSRLLRLGLPAACLSTRASRASDVGELLEDEQEAEREATQSETAALLPPSQLGRSDAPPPMLI